MTLDESLRDEEAAQVITALMQIRGVVSVEPVTEGVDVMIATARVRMDTAKRFLDFYDGLARGSR